jgi:hypothetical protein
MLEFETNAYLDGVVGNKKGNIIKRERIWGKERE